MDADLKEVRFDKWCERCKHYAHKFPKENFSFEAQEPCASCLEAENSMREGSEKPEYWEEK